METNNNKINRYILFIFAFIFIFLEIHALQIESHYKYDVPMCMFLLGFVYYYRHAIKLLWLHYLLFALFLFMHCLGMYELYSSYPLGIEYDYWVHGFFGLIIALVILRSLQNSKLQFNKMISIACVIVIVLGISAAHELYEYAGAVLLGSGEGVLFIGAGDLDQWDTQKDMLNNVVGGVLGVVIHESIEMRKKIMNN